MLSAVGGTGRAGAECQNDGTRMLAPFTIIGLGTLALYCVSLLPPAPSSLYTSPHLRPLRLSPEANVQASRQAPFPSMFPSNIQSMGPPRPPLAHGAQPQPTTTAETSSPTAKQQPPTATAAETVFAPLAAAMGLVALVLWKLRRMITEKQQPELWNLLAIRDLPPSPPLFPHKGTKFVVVVGGVCSSLGKGVTCSSIGAVVRSSGYRVTAIKIDGYLNTDAGLMSPFEHGEVFVLDDGGEVDTDLGNYERLLDLHLKSDNNITTGKIYKQVMENERKGHYLGQTVKMVPHVSTEIVNTMLRVGSTPTDGSMELPQICMVELGGTVGDMESGLFLEALRQLKMTVGAENFCLVQCTLVPVVSGSQKVEPSQEALKTLLSAGLQPNIVVCRCEEPIRMETRHMLSQMCGVPNQAVLSVQNVPDAYDVPGVLAQGGIMNLLTIQMRLDFLQKFNPKTLRPNTGLISLEGWSELAHRNLSSTTEVVIAIVAKHTRRDLKGSGWGTGYTGDTYLSVVKALEHASIAVGRELHILWVSSAELESDTDDPEYKRAMSKLECADGILVPGGFGDRGITGKIVAANWARRNKTPFLGVCLGMQMAVVGFCQDELGLDGCTSEEFDIEGQATHVLRYMPEVSLEYMGPNMVLGSRKIRLSPDSITSKLYGGLTEVMERQRHRYEVNQKLVPAMEAAGLIFTGKDVSGERMEVVELAPSLGHPYFIGLQCHPEFKSRPEYPSPPYLGLVMAAAGKLEEGLEECMKKGPVNHYKPSWYI